MPAIGCLAQLLLGWKSPSRTAGKHIAIASQRKRRAMLMLYQILSIIAKPGVIRG
jgi:hypothetical protein